MPEYRADIDGLRAIAILPVVFFHAGFGFAQGGFVGVDVFFVISGYLITSLIHREMVAGEFSLVRFYERRVRRLFPALFAVIAACAAVATWLLLPPDLRYFGGSLFATTLFSSNIFFWLEAGYFDVAAERKPLLHTWSLAVEEQFYLLFPLFLLLALRYLPRRLVAVTGGVTVVSLLASESLDPASGLCGTGRCQVESGGRPLYFDEHHLSVHGATAVAEALRPAFE